MASPRAYHVIPDVPEPAPSNSGQRPDRCADIVGQKLRTVRESREQEIRLIRLRGDQRHTRLVASSMFGEDFDGCGIECHTAVLVCLGVFEVPTTRSVLGDTLAKREHGSVEIEVGPADGTQLTSTGTDHDG